MPHFGEHTAICQENISKIIKSVIEDCSPSGSFSHACTGFNKIPKNDDNEENSKLKLKAESLQRIFPYIVK